MHTQIQKETKIRFDFETINNLFGANRKETLKELKELEESKKNTWKNIMTSLSADTSEIKTQKTQAIIIEEEVL
jgi:hypothetical protein